MTWPPEIGEPLPRGEDAYNVHEKLRDYSLSVVHKGGREKAAGFRQILGITSDDMIWYGDYNRGVLGRLDPKTGQFKEWPSPSGPLSAPYGMAAIGNVIWYNESGANPNTIVRFDPKTEKFQSWALPSGGGAVRAWVRRDGDAVVVTLSDAQDQPVAMMRTLPVVVSAAVV